VKVTALTKSVRLSPAQVEENLTPAQKRKLEALVFKPVGEPVVVADTDRRSPVLATRINFEPTKRGEEDDG
jgi:hypothetical protein